MTKKTLSMKEQHKRQMWKKIKVIRANWNNPSKLHSLLTNWENEYSADYNDLASELVSYHTRKAWAKIAEEEGNNTIDDLIDILWESLRRVGGEYTVEETTEGVQIYCTKCPIADSYLKIGKPHFGLIFHCITDPHICEGFNPNIKFRRSKTLMNGDDCCDHHYSMKAP
ncbi:MAG: L-2-amino-thiazoline-4-carboxylic acid hydrolase [Promethearchaeota archaeon]